MKYLVVAVTFLSLCIGDVAAITCGDQAGSRGARCVTIGRNCPSGFRPVFYDSPTPCRSGQRCCI
ncbi:hypothetical protein M3J09_010662 [Ascochyta lentis]